MQDWGALSRFAEDAYVRNRRICAAPAASLLLAGSFLVSCESSIAVLVPGGAGGCLHLYAPRQTQPGHARIVLAGRSHGDLSTSELRQNALAGTVPKISDWQIWIVAVSAALCYTVGSRRVEAQGKRRLLGAVPAVLASFAAAALVVVAIAWLSAGRPKLNPSRLSVIRTIVNCAMALTLGFLGSRWRRLELGWIAYIAVTFGTRKLLFEDLRFGNPRLAGRPTPPDPPPSPDRRPQPELCRKFLIRSFWEGLPDDSWAGSWAGSCGAFRWLKGALLAPEVASQNALRASGSPSQLSSVSPDCRPRMANVQALATIVNSDLRPVAILWYYVVYDTSYTTH